MKIAFFLIPFLLFVSCASSAFPASEPAGGEATEISFYPRGADSDAIVNEIRGATKEILIPANTFTETAIAAALSDARKRGIRIGTVVERDRKISGESMAAFLSRAGVPVLNGSARVKARYKTMVIDGSTLITGVFNFNGTENGKNIEELLILKGNTKLVGQYLNYIRH